MQNGIDILVGVQAHQPGGPVSQLIERPVDPISVGRPRTAQNRRTVAVRNREGSVARAAVDDDEPIDEIANTFPTPPRMLFFVVRENEHRKNLVGHVASSHRVLAPHRGQRRIPLTPVRNYPLMPESAPETSPYPPSRSLTPSRERKPIPLKGDGLPIRSGIMESRTLRKRNGKILVAGYAYEDSKASNHHLKAAVAYTASSFLGDPIDTAR
jgi:hypothetical protein